MDSFSEEMLIVNEEGPTKSFDDPVPRSKVKTMKDCRSVGQTKSKSVRMNGADMHLRLLAISSFRKVPLYQKLSFETAHVPLK